MEETSKTHSKPWSFKKLTFYRFKVCNNFCEHKLIGFCIFLTTTISNESQDILFLLRHSSLLRHCELSKTIYILACEAVEHSKWHAVKFVYIKRQSLSRQKATLNLLFCLVASIKLYFCHVACFFPLIVLYRIFHLYNSITYRITTQRKINLYSSFT